MQLMTNLRFTVLHSMGYHDIYLDLWRVYDLICIYVRSAKLAGHGRPHLPAVPPVRRDSDHIEHALHATRA
jgi:hypothetical protein